MGRRSVTPSSDTRVSCSSEIWGNNPSVTLNGSLFKGESVSGAFVPSRQRSSGPRKVSLKDQIIPPLEDADLRLKGARRLTAATMRERSTSAASNSTAGERTGAFIDMRLEGGTHETWQRHERSLHTGDSSVASEPSVPATQRSATGMSATAAGTSNCADAVNNSPEIYVGETWDVDASESRLQLAGGAAHRDFAFRGARLQKEAHAQDDLIDAIIAVAKDDEAVGHALKQVSFHVIISLCELFSCMKTGLQGNACCARDASCVNSGLGKRHT
jgi:hypothetical protein